jgi:general secretion pathway protein G
MGVVQCFDDPRARFPAEVARFPWRPSPDEDRIISAKGDLWNLRTWLSAYKRDVNSFPSTAQGLSAVRERPQGVRRWNRQYTPKEIPKDPWSHDYAYRHPGEHGNDPDLICLAADGLPGGEVVNADIVNWKSPNQ